jgi:hypothetical protein
MKKSFLIASFIIGMMITAQAQQSNETILREFTGYFLTEMGSDTAVCRPQNYEQKFSYRNDTLTVIWRCGKPMVLSMSDAHVNFGYTHRLWNYEMACFMTTMRNILTANSVGDANRIESYFQMAEKSEYVEFLAEQSSRFSFVDKGGYFEAKLSTCDITNFGKGSIFGSNIPLDGLVLCTNGGDFVLISPYGFCILYQVTTSFSISFESAKILFNAYTTSVN